ncbi:hypothetical protein TNCV_3193291 [Trichonephila clavipes]|nr:hypothetical protein TNCV_3193291 [Trichonephila clavipes]
MVSRNNGCHADSLAAPGSAICGYLLCCKQANVLTPRNITECSCQSGLSILLGVSGQMALSHYMTFLMTSLNPSIPYSHDCRIDRLLFCRYLIPTRASSASLYARHNINFSQTINIQMQFPNEKTDA